MSRLRVVLDTGDTLSVPNFSLPTSKTLSQRRTIQTGKESQYAEFVFDVAAGGDTTNWGVRYLIAYGVSQPRDLDL